MQSNIIKNRNYGVDLLRNLSMFMVVMLHVLGVGGLLAATIDSPIKYHLLKVLHISSMCAVNCYGLISGYIGYRSKFRVSSIITLWLQVFFYSFGIALIFLVAMPEAVAIKDVIKLSLPVIFNRYWYFTSYFALFFTMPLLNAAIENIPKRTFEISFGVLTFLLTVCSQTVILDNQFGINNGYSYIWLVILYCIGGYLAKYKIEIKKSVSALLYLGCVAICWLSQFVLKKIGFSSPERLEAYNSPFVLLMAVFLVLLFANMKLPKIIAKVVSILAPASFAVYLIHLHPLVRNNLLLDAFTKFGQLPTVLVVIFAILATIVIYLLCSGIDYIRLFLFKLFKIKDLSKKLDVYIFKNGGNE